MYNYPLYTDNKQYLSLTDVHINNNSNNEYVHVYFLNTIQNNSIFSFFMSLSILFQFMCSFPNQPLSLVFNISNVESSKMLTNSITFINLYIYLSVKHSYSFYYIYIYIIKVSHIEVNKQNL